MESARLLIRPMEDGDESAFVRGIADRDLRAAYGFPVDMEEDVSVQIFRHFRGLNRALSLVGKESGEMIGFLLDLAPELPEETASSLPEKGRTLAYAVFPPYQRKGYMQEALETLVPELFQAVEYIHCGHFEENEPSRNLLRKLGFRECAGHTAGKKLIVDEILFSGQR